MKLSFTNRAILRATLAGLLLGPLSAGGLAETEEPPTVEAAPLLAHVKKLADDAWEGRGSGTPGEKAATQYIADHFRGLGLEPAGAGGDWFQPVPMAGPFSIGADCSLTITTAGNAGRPAFVLDRDFRPFSSSATAVAEGELVFAGYGIAAGKLYDDYAGLDVQGRIVVVLRGAPRARGWSGNRTIRQHAPFVQKVARARERGAIGLVVVNDPASFPAAANQPGGRDAPGRRGARRDALVRQNIGGETSIPFVHMTLASARRLFPAAFGARIEELEAAILTAQPGSPRPASRASTVRARVATAVERKTLWGRNVCALLRAGAPDAVDEVVVVGAHHDHLGRGQNGSLARSANERKEIHNGADDNGSGTAACLEVARVLAAQRHRLRRSILFLTFTGEERGLLGSVHYCANPTVPLGKTVAMLNMDMVGRRGNRPLFVGGVKTSPSFRAILAAHAKKLDLPVQFGDGGMAPSDNTSFYRRGLPVLFFFTGLHPDYHRPGDDWPKLDIDSMGKIATLCARTALDVANLKERPKFVRADRGGSGPPRPILGINVGRAEGGVGIAAVRPDGPARAAGLRGGDVILVLADKPTPDVAALRAVMRDLRIGQEVAIRVRRGKETIEVKLKLGRG